MKRQIAMLVVILALFVCSASAALYHKNGEGKYKPAEGIVELRRELLSKLNSLARIDKQKRETATKNDPANVNRDIGVASDKDEEILENMSEEFKGNPCATEPCKNDGECKRRKDQTPNFVCICKTGYLGKLCGKKVTDGFSISWDIVYTLCGIAGAVVLVTFGVSIHICRINNRRNIMKKQFEELLETGQMPTSHPPGILATSSELCRSFWCCGKSDVKAPGKKSHNGTAEKSSLIKYSSHRKQRSNANVLLEKVRRSEATVPSSRVHHTQRNVSSTISNHLLHKKQSFQTRVPSEKVRRSVAKVTSKVNHSQKKVSFANTDNLPHQKQSSHASIPLENLRRSVAALQSKLHDLQVSFNNSDNLPHQKKSSHVSVTIQNLRRSVATLQSRMHH